MNIGRHDYYSRCVGMYVSRRLNEWSYIHMQRLFRRNGPFRCISGYIGLRESSCINDRRFIAIQSPLNDSMLLFIASRTIRNVGMSASHAQPQQHIRWRLWQRLTEWRRHSHNFEVYPITVVTMEIHVSYLVWFILRPCQHDNGYIDGRSQIKKVLLMVI